MSAPVDPDALTDRTAYDYRTAYDVQRTNDGKDNAMAVLTSWVLEHKTTVMGLWLAIAVAAFAAIGPATDSLSQQFTVPGEEGLETNQQLASIYGNGGDVAPLVPVVTLPQGKTVDSPGVTDELDAALSKVEAALPDARTASYASTRDRAFVSEDGRTTFALVYIPGKGGVDPGQAEAGQAQAALADATVGGSAVEVTGLDALRAAAGDNDSGSTGVLLETLVGRSVPSWSSLSSSARRWLSCRC
jgi:RND superfamily putative drug exporter